MKGASTSGNVPPEEDSDHDIHATDKQATDIQEEDTQDTVTQNKEDFSDITPVSEAILEAETETHYDPTPPKKQKITPKQINSDKLLIEWLELKKKKEMKNIQEDQQDSDWFFFRSLLPDFKKLNNKRKRHLKLKFATILNKELDRTDADVEDSNSTSHSWGSSTTSFQPPSSSMVQSNTTSTDFVF